MLTKPSTCSGCPLYDGPYGKHSGFSVPDGNGYVLVVAEALGEHEEQAGIALVGKAGHFLFSNLARVGIERESFTVFNCVACRPPLNKLSKMPYEFEAIHHCSPNLEAAIAETRERAKTAGKTFVIVTLGRIAFRTVMKLSDRHPIMTEKSGYLGYPFWSEDHSAWVYASDHPSFLMRGNLARLPILQFVFQRALKTANEGLTLDVHQYLLDPEPAIFAKWVEDYRYAVDHDPLHTILSYDIETPYKQGENEDELDDEGLDWTILRCAFAYQPNVSVSVPWRADYLPMFEDLFGYDGMKLGWNSAQFDRPRIQKQVPFNGTEVDGMLAWHVLNSSMRKSLGFVTPFYAQTTSMWKHLAEDEPAFYNAKDADMALRCWLGINEGLKLNSQGKVFDRHVMQVNDVFSYMSRQGLLRDEAERLKGERRLVAILGDIKAKMDAGVPLEARKLKVYKKLPQCPTCKGKGHVIGGADQSDPMCPACGGDGHSTAGMIEVDGVRNAKKCPNCGLLDVTAAHFKSMSKRRLHLGDDENPCVGLKPEKVDVATKLWAKPLEFKVSNKALQQYQSVLDHKAILSSKRGAEGKITFDADAITRLMKKYPKDPIYPLIATHSEHQKLLGAFIGVRGVDGTLQGGLPVGRDGRIHPTLTHNPSTLRSSCVNPNLQQIPRPSSDADAIANICRNQIVAAPGHILYARDYSGIEAVLTGYFARDPRYMRLAKIDVHSFYTAYALNQLDGRFPTADLPDLAWPDEKLIPALASIKKHFKHDRNSLYKHLVHAANFGQSARGAKEKVFHDTGVEFDVKLIQRVMDIYFELFPLIKKWHTELPLQAEKDGFIKNPFAYVHRFAGVFEYEKIGGKWQRKNGPSWNKVLAFLPQSTAAGIIKEAMLRIFQERFEECGQFLRLLIHDELLMEVPEGQLSIVDAIVKEEMEQPVPELALPASFGMGPCLGILTEAKQGYRWGQLK